ncbi:hypothetical protein HID58_021338, partial [Brassica napus]
MTLLNMCLLSQRPWRDSHLETVLHVQSRRYSRDNNMIWINLNRVPHQDRSSYCLHLQFLDREETSLMISSLSQNLSDLADDFVFNFWMLLYHPKEPRECNRTRLAYTLHDHLVNKLMNHLNSFPQTFLIPNVQEPHSLPHKRRNHEPKKSRLRRFLKSLSKRDNKKIRTQSSRVVAKTSDADVVKRQTQEHILEIKSLLMLHKPSRMHFCYDDPSLLLPRLVIGVKDTVLEEIVEPFVEEDAFGEVLEVGLEHVLDVSGYASHGSVRTTEPDSATSFLLKKNSGVTPNTGHVVGPGFLANFSRTQQKTNSPNNARETSKRQRTPLLWLSSWRQLAL